MDMDELCIWFDDIREGAKRPRVMVGLKKPAFRSIERKGVLSCHLVLCWWCQGESSGDESSGDPINGPRLRVHLVYAQNMV